MSLGIGLSLGMPFVGGVTGASIALSASSIAEDATNGTAIGNLSVVNPPAGHGVYVFTVNSDPDGLFAISGGALDKNGTLDYEAAASHQVQIKADDSTTTVILQWVTIAVTNVAPVLSNPTDTKTGQTTASITVDTTETTGTLYWVVTTSGTAPTAAQIKAGKDNSGVSAAASGTQAIATSGTKTVSVTGLTAATAYTAHFVHTEGTPGFLDSNVASGDGFTTDAVAPAGYDIILTTGDSNKFYGASFDGALDVVDADVKQLGYTSPNTNAVIAALDPMDWATEGVTSGKIGHDQHFAKDYYKGNGLLLGSRKALIVTNAKGGSHAGTDSAFHWGALTGTAGTPTTSAGSLLDVTSARLATALALPDTNTVVAVLDLEGSNAYSDYGNSFIGGPLSGYRADLHRKYQYLRNLVGATVPILIARQTKDAINAAGGVYSTNGVIVDRIIQSIAANFPYTGVANSQSPTELGGDGVSGNVHFTAAEQRTLAGRYYTVYLAALANTGRTVAWDTDALYSADGFTAGFTLTNSNLDLSGDANSGWKTGRATGPLRSGKAYCEVKVQAMASGTDLGMLGLCNADFGLISYLTDAGSNISGPAPMSAAQWGGNPTNFVAGYTKDWTGTASWTTSDIIMLAVNMTTGKAWIGKNGTWYNSGDPAAGTGNWISGIVDPIYIAASIYTGTGNTYRLAPTSGSFTYTPPSGFSAWGT